MDIEGWARRIAAGERRALARAITLVESVRDEDRAVAEDLLRAARPSSDSVRIGLSGSPGVGKSTFIETFGRHVIAAGHRLAVLAVDPSSARSGGSILGDKTRMTRLAREADVFIRPTPAGTVLGGVARRTRESIALVEAAGFDVVLVETVGVGQSETAVAEMVDLFLLLLAPAGGDELQGIKRGIMELADIVVVNKADGAFAAAARHAAADHRGALALMRPKWATWQPVVLLASSLEGSGIAEVWQAVEEFRVTLGTDGTLARQRRDQALRWLWREIEDAMRERLRGDPVLAAQVRAEEQAVADGRESAAAAARAIIDRLLAGRA